MEVALASVATGALQSVVKKLQTLLGEEYKRFKGIRREVEWLTRELEAMRTFLLVNMSEAEDRLDDQDKLWVKVVRELSYDIEDSLDEFFRLHAASNKSAKPNRFLKKIRSLLESIKSRHRIAKEIQDIKTKVIDVAERNKRYRVGDHPHPAGGHLHPAVHQYTFDPRAHVIAKDAKKLIGIDGQKGEIIRLLEDQKEQHTEQHDSPTQQEPTIVSIVGSGGLGKTTLAHQVYQQLKDQFECQTFFSVSRNPDINGVLREILYKVVNPKDIKGDYVNTSTAQLIAIIMGSLEKEKKRFFIVLDDIWETETWETIYSILRMTHHGSKIIITTRINKVALKWCSSTNGNGHIYNMRPLNMAHSAQLFYGRLFNPEKKCPSDLEGISCKILEKCAGLPLAIIAISGLLSTKEETKEEWDLVENSIGRALDRSNSDVKEMIEILSLSYFDLPPRLRTCLLYLSIFPEDHTIGKDSLIRRWIGEGFIHEQNHLGEGFIHEQNHLQAYKSGENCFNELINRSLIQPVEIDEFDEVKSCRVHDTVLDFIVSKAIEENFVTLVGVQVPVVNPVAGNKVRRLSMQNNGKIPSGLVLSSVRSLNVFGSNVEIPSLSEFRLLRVLAFEDCGQLQDNDLADVGDLLHLKYLRLNKENSVTELSKAVVSEETDELHHRERKGYGDCCEVKMEIPAVFCQVARLECLVTLVAHRETILPDGIADMKALRVLEGVNVYLQSFDIIEGIGELKNLRKLGIVFINSDAGRGWEDDREIYEEMASSICKLSSCLDSLHIRTLNEPAELLNMISDEDGDTPGLTELVVMGWSIDSDLADLWPLLVKLKKLHFCTQRLSKEDVETLGRISGLKYLCINLYDGYYDPDDDECDDPDELKARLERAMNAQPNRPKLVRIDWD